MNDTTLPAASAPTGDREPSHFRIRITPNIDTGHLLQAVILVSTVVWFSAGLDKRIALLEAQNQRNAGVLENLVRTQEVLTQNNTRLTTLIEERFRRP